MSRPRHPNGHFEELFKRAEKMDWRIEGGGGVHFRMLCPCPAKHVRVVSTTPKNETRALKLVIRELRKACWREP